jgi:hypothetical protein
MWAWGAFGECLRMQSGSLYLDMDCGENMEVLWNEYGDRAVGLTC